MLCQKIFTQLPLVGLGGGLSHQPNLKPQEEMDFSVEDLRKFRRNNYQWRTRTPELKAKMKAKLHRQYLKHRDKHRELGRRWVLNNRDKRIEIQRRYREKHREKLRQYSIEKYYRDCDTRQTQEWKDRHNNYVSEKRKKSPQFLIAERLRASMHQAIRRQFGEKSVKTRELLGCSVAELKLHLESRFTNGMSWDNRKSFVIDHFVPCAAFDLTNVEEQRWAFNWRNLRPIEHHQNQVKSDTIPSPLPGWLPAWLQDKINARR